jgi:hypothetical protein
MQGRVRTPGRAVRITRRRKGAECNTAAHRVGGQNVEEAERFLSPSSPLQTRDHAWVTLHISWTVRYCIQTTERCDVTGTGISFHDAALVCQRCIHLRSSHRTNLSPNGASAASYDTAMFQHGCVPRSSFINTAVHKKASTWAFIIHHETGTDMDLRNIRNINYNCPKQMIITKGPLCRNI